MLLVPLSMTKGRCRFEQGERNPDCGSLDCLVPDTERYDAPYSSECGTMMAGRIAVSCPEARKGGRCRINYDLVALHIVLGEKGEHRFAVPFTIRLKGYGCDAALDLNTWSGMRGLRYHDVQLEMYATPEKNDLGSFFAPRFRGFRALDIGRYDSFAERFVGYDLANAMSEDDDGAF